MIKEAMFYERREEKKVECYLCAHNCKINPGQSGFCRVRKNTEGILNTLVYGQAIVANVDPIEKKPLYHFLPGSKSFSLATIGCNFRCGFCQNWQISQRAKEGNIPLARELMPEQVIQEARKRDCQSISYTYTEPTIFFEYAYDCAKLAKESGLKNIFVTNGYIGREALEAISPYLDAVNIDLKSFSEEFYIKNCQGSLQPVLDSIKFAKELGIWLEITTLIIPGQNDSELELTSIAKFIANIDKDIPWHLSRFHPDYKFLNQKPTPIKSLKKAEDIGKKAGLKYVYLGNVNQDANTYCDNCQKILLSRSHFDLIENNIIEGKCKFCGKVISGVY
ncbi:MAG: AmmeMemoRadiSam system radical SAM enzyme [Candidatus Susulua stagnicola]|nr:AmmeMemoRadiSam system radical SAM enzyme [Candidatus Susulua stagnicola]